MKKKVLFVIDSLTCGGAEKSLVSLLPLLDYDKMEVELLMVKRGGIFDRYVPSNINIQTIPNPRGIKAIWTYICRLYFSFLLRFLPAIGIKRNSAELNWIARSSAFMPIQQSYDVAVAYQQGFSTYYVAQKIKARKKIAWINNDLKKIGFRESYNRPFYDKMDYIVAVSEVLCKMLEQTDYVDSKKLCTIYDILDPETIRKMAKEKGFEDKFPSDTWRIVTVGRIVPQKNYTLAVETARLLKEQGLSFRWYFIGEGCEYDDIKALINQYGLQQEVVLMGLKKNPYPFMAGCDIYVQTSSYEGYGLTLCEARILHKPEVCTNFPVAYNQIQDGVNGLIAEMTPQSVAEKISNLINDGRLRKILIAATFNETFQTKETETRKINALLTE